MKIFDIASIGKVGPLRTQLARLLGKIPKTLGYKKARTQSTSNSYKSECDYAELVVDGVER